MKKKIVVWFVVVFLLAACSTSADSGRSPQAAEGVTEIVEVEGEPVQATRVITDTIEVVPENAAEAQAPGSINENAPLDRPAVQGIQPRLIVKNGRMTLTVEDTHAAVRGAMDIMVAAGGYVINQQVRTYNGFPYATIEMAVPVDTFESTVDRLRGLGTVEDESATGQDVTEEFVDLESRLDNLRATQARLREFLDQAQTIDEVLTVNRQLTTTEEEIEVILGRMNYLESRAAFSTIQLTINPIAPTPTPTPTATPTPTPTPEVWMPGETAALAAGRLERSAKSLADFTIYNGIVLGPWLLLFALFGYIAWHIGRFLIGRMENPPQPTTSDGD